jgi:hypothetical protein
VNAPARTNPRGLAALPTDRIVSFAWELADLIDASVLANEPESPWRMYARQLEKQAHALVTERHGLKGVRR